MSSDCHGASSDVAAISDSGIAAFSFQPLTSNVRLPDPLRCHLRCLDPDLVGAVARFAGSSRGGLANRDRPFLLIFRHVPRGKLRGVFVFGASLRQGFPRLHSGLARRRRYRGRALARGGGRPYKESWPRKGIRDAKTARAAGGTEAGRPQKVAGNPALHESGSKGTGVRE